MHLNGLNVFLAQAPGSAPAQPPQPTGLQSLFASPIMLLVLMGVMMYFLLFRPQQQRTKLPVRSVAELIDFYGVQVTGEIQRLRVNTERRVFVAFETGIGYVQCQPQTSPPSIYCEAQSAENWEALAGVLTPERVARLHTIGFADPGRGPNYWKKYPQDQVNDPTIAHELLAVLHDVYGYTGMPKLKVVTEERTR